MDGKDDRREGQFDEAKGNVKEAFGDVTDNEELEREGKKDQTKGKAKQALGKTKDAAAEAKDAANDAVDRPQGSGLATARDGAPGPGPGAYVAGRPTRNPIRSRCGTSSTRYRSASAPTSSGSSPGSRSATSRANCARHPSVPRM